MRQSRRAVVSVPPARLGYAVKPPPLYFAYGSNLDQDQMARRCPGAYLLGPAILPGHRLTFGGFSRRWGGAVASIAPDRRFHVPGLVYGCSPADIARLDDFEGHPNQYRRQLMRVVRDGGQPVVAFVYVKTVMREEAPAAKYLRVIEAAYERWGWDRRGLCGLPEGRPRSASA